jgi:hypothetical protein
MLTAPSKWSTLAMCVVNDARLEARRGTGYEERDRRGQYSTLSTRESLQYDFNIQS